MTITEMNREQVEARIKELRPVAYPTDAPVNAAAVREVGKLRERLAILEAEDRQTEMFARLEKSRVEREQRKAVLDDVLSHPTYRNGF